MSKKRDRMKLNSSGSLLQSRMLLPFPNGQEVSAIDAAISRRAALVSMDLGLPKTLNSTPFGVNKLRVMAPLGMPKNTINDPVIVTPSVVLPTLRAGKGPSIVSHEPANSTLLETREKYSCKARPARVSKGSGSGAQRGFRPWCK